MAVVSGVWWLTCCLFVWLQRAEFQAILDKAENTAEARLCKYRELSALAHDFVHASKTYGKIIVQESFLPRAYKTIKPGTLLLCLDPLLMTHTNGRELRVLPPRSRSSDGSGF